MPPDVGRLGEAVVQGWAAQTGLILNRSTDHDAAGWDFILAWPHDPLPASGLTLPLDRRPGPLQCLVQVKATTRRPRRWDVKLSNWRRFVRAPLPCFYVVLEFGPPTGEGSGAIAPPLALRRAFLVHVGAPHVRAVLHRERELHARHGHVDLHRHTHGLTWCDGDELAPLDGPTFRRRIESYVGADVDAYHLDKLALTRTVGYERGGRHVNARVRVPEGWRGDPRDLVLDFQLGLVPYLEVASAEVVDTRFDIPLPVPAETLDGAVLESAGAAPVGSAHLRLRVPSLDQEVRLDLAARVARDERPGEPPRVKSRFSAVGIDVTWRQPGGAFAITLALPDVQTAQPIGELYPAATCVALLEAAHQAGASVEYDLRLNGAALGQGTLPAPAPVAQPMSEWATLVRNAWTVAVDASLPATLPVRVEDLARSHEPLFVLAALLKPTVMPMRAEVTIGDPITRPDLPWYVPLAGEAQIGSYLVRFAGGLVGQPTVLRVLEDGGRRYRIETTDRRIETRRLYAHGEVPAETVADLYDAVVRAHSEDNTVVGLRSDDTDDSAAIFVPRPR